MSQNAQVFYNPAFPCDTSNFILDILLDIPETDHGVIKIKKNQHELKKVSPMKFG